MASAGKETAQELQALSNKERKLKARTRALDSDREEAARMLAQVEDQKRAKIHSALDSIKKRYFQRLLGNRGVKVLAPRVSGVEEATLGKVTTIPKIVQRNLNEIEIQPILKNYSYVRVLYDTMANEYFYEVIEPKLLEEEEELLEVLKEILVESLELQDDATPATKEQYLRRIVEGLLRELGVELHPVSKERILYYVIRDFIRFGPIDVTMIDTQVEDISCDGVNVPFYIYHRKYGSIPSNLRFESAVELDSFVIWLAQRCGKHISVAQPMLDATIPDGSRLQATLGMHVTKRGSSFTIRRFRENPFTPLDLVRFKTMSPEMMAYLWLSIENGQSMLICGGTASGKTTTLNAILLFIPPQMKIVSIEDTRELNLPHENWVPLLTRAGFGGRVASTGKPAGEIDMFDLLTAALRQRPQYMMIGEVRGPEAFVVFQAMATGKSAYTTFHADDVQAMVHRLENDPINLPRALVAALDIVLLQAQVKVGTDMTRRVKAIVEVVGTDPESNAEGRRPGSREEASQDQEQDGARMVRDEPSRKRRPERSDTEDAQERETEGEAAKGPRHFSRNEDVLKGLEREQEEPEKQRRGRERASRREDRQKDQDRGGGDR